MSCWRRAADNVVDSLVRGQPVVVHGRLRGRSYEVEGQRRTSLEIDAITVGHDLSRGVARFRKTVSGSPDGGGGAVADGRTALQPVDAVARTPPRRFGGEAPAA